MPRQRPAVTILYEDRRGPTKNFGLHQLVVACVHDAIDGDRWRYKDRIDARPLKGRDKVVAALRTEASDICPDGRPLIAFLDADEAYRAVQGLLASTPYPAVVQAITNVIQPGATFASVMLLDQNAETVIAAAKACEPSLSDELVSDALRHDRGARDSILTSMAWSASQPIRDCILGRVPSLKALVDRVAQIPGI